ncbi:MAG: B12-binding domain-containing radical SAM protein, partial [Chloroflexota bacterium]
LDDLPIPLHEMLPYKKYVMPLMKGPFTFIVTSRGCTAGCIYCIKHVSYQYTVRLRSPEKVLEELWVLKKLGINNVNMYADLFTANRDQVIGICKAMIDADIKMKWTCNSRVDYVDEEMLNLMAKAGCFLMTWGIESGSEQVLRHARKGAYPETALRSLTWARKAGIKNWGYFIIGLPTETEETIRQTIEFSKKLPLDIALFHVAAPYPGTPFFFEVVRENWFRPGTRWEQVDMDKGTVLDYPGLPAEKLLYWQKRAFREWALRPGPIMTYLKMLFSDFSTMKSAVSVGMQHFQWLTGKSES